jgi:GNAT superfamily N-acetyltransferase
MTIEVREPDVEELGAAVDVLREWQYEGAPMQLHPGDLGWFWRFGAEALAVAVRTWSRGGRVLAVGFVDGPELLRMTIAPDAQQDEELARQVAADVADPARGVLAAGEAFIEAPMQAVLQDVLAEQGWRGGEAWTPLRRVLAEPVTEPDLRVEVVGLERPEHVAARVAVQRAAFATSTFTEARWDVMAAGPVYADARCLVGYDENDDAVAAVTVWSAGPGKPGLLEPMGVHREHRGRGYGKAITEAAAAALRELGASSAIVATASANVGGVATYKVAGFEARAEIRDVRREA